MRADKAGESCACLPERRGMRNSADVSWPRPPLAARVSDTTRGFSLTQGSFRLMMQFMRSFMQVDHG